MKRFPHDKKINRKRKRKKNKLKNRRASPQGMWPTLEKKRAKVKNSINNTLLINRVRLQTKGK